MSRRISEKYAPVGKIGEGTYGLVYKARMVQTPTIPGGGDAFVAVKKFKSFKSGDGISPTAIREIKLLRELKNRYIVDLVDVMLDEEDKALYLVFDFAEHDLLEMIRWHHSRTVGYSHAHTHIAYLLTISIVTTNANANGEIITLANSARYQLFAS